METQVKRVECTYTQWVQVSIGMLSAKLQRKIRSAQFNSTRSTICLHLLNGKVKEYPFVVSKRLLFNNQEVNPAELQVVTLKEFTTRCSKYGDFLVEETTGAEQKVLTLIK